MCLFHFITNIPVITTQKALGNINTTAETYFFLFSRKYNIAKLKAIGVMRKLPARFCGLLYAKVIFNYYIVSLKFKVYISVIHSKE